MYVRTFYNHVPMPPEHIEGKSETIPDQSLSVREIIDRYRLGRIDNLPIDEGDDDDIDSYGEDFEDLVDANDAFADGVEIFSSSQEEVPPASPPAGSSSETPPVDSPVE